MRAPVLTVERLTVRHPGAVGNALEGCSLSIGHGEHVALVGLNGSGKTSLLFAIAGLLPHTGVITLDGVRLTARSVSAIRKRIGFLFANPDDQLLFPVVREDVAYSLAGRGWDALAVGERVERMLERMGAGSLADASPYALSHGQKLRVALASALVHEPPLLLLDEPSSALDPPGRRALAVTLRDQPGAMLMATHDLAFAEACCTRFIHLDRGMVVRDTPRREEIDL